MIRKAAAPAEWLAPRRLPWLDVLRSRGGRDRQIPRSGLGVERSHARRYTALRGRKPARLAQD